MLPTVTLLAVTVNVTYATPKWSDRSSLGGMPSTPRTGTSPSPSSAPTRQRILTAAAELFRRHGYTGTGMKQIVAAAGAPFGSLYHFFPGGKDQLTEEVVRTSGQMYLELFYAVADAAADAPSAARDFFLGAAEVLRQTDYVDACPIETIALEVASTNEPLRQATADVFDSWIAGVTGRFVDEGVPAERARELAIQFISAVEGAFVLCRALRTTEPLEVAAVWAYDAVAAELAKARGSSGRAGGGRRRRV